MDIIREKIDNDHLRVQLWCIGFDHSGCFKRAIAVDAHIYVFTDTFCPLSFWPNRLTKVSSDDTQNPSEKRVPAKQDSWMLRIVRF